MLIVDCTPAEPDSKVSSVVAWGKYWISTMTQSNLLLCLINHDRHSAINAHWVLLGWCCQINHGLPPSSPLPPWIPHFPLTLLPWQQSPDSGTLNQDTWVLLISHVESLRYFPLPLLHGSWVLPPPSDFGLFPSENVVCHSREWHLVLGVQWWPSKSASGSTL